VQDTVAPAALAVARLEATSWVDRHARPFWNYWNFPVFAGIWAPLALSALAVPFARLRAGRYVPYVAGLAWLLIALLLLSVVPEKKERYMLPLMPPLALLMAGLLRHLETTLQRPLVPTLEKRLLRIWAGLLVLFFVLVPVALAVLRLPGAQPGTWVFGLVALLFGALAIVAGLVLVRRPRPVVLTGVSLVAMSALVTLLLPAHARWADRRTDPTLPRVEHLQRNPALARVPWYTLEEPHMKQGWRAGPGHARLAPHSGFSAAASAWSRGRAEWHQRSRPTTARLARAGPPARGRQFLLDRQRKDGYWRVTLVEPN
jgi:4-amino-4-deoxy-L-arabinose transferase-like glycosyltransferase